MQEFDELLEVARTLLGPGGCPWDAKQTFFSLQPYVLEEAHEVVEAVDGQNDQEIIEELGDLLYTVVFYAKLAEKEKRFSMADILSSLKEKLVRRHPHVFSSLSVENEEEIVKNWERIKQEEAGKKERISRLEGIPEQLPLLAKAQKMLGIFVKTGFLSKNSICTKESSIALALWDLVQEAENAGLDVESLFRRHIAQQRTSFIAWEKERLTPCIQEDALEPKQ